MGWQEWLGSALRVARWIRKPQSRASLVVPCTHAGSLGDQAMLDVLVGELVSRGHRVRFLEYRWPFFRLRSPLTVVDLSEGGRNARALTALSELLTVEHCAYLGADVLNDRYGLTRRHLDFLRVAQAAGVGVHIQGFSLEQDSGPVTSRQLRALADVDALIRDPVSYANSEYFGLRHRRLVADMAFLLRPEAEAPSIHAAMQHVQEWKAEGCFVLGVNVSGPMLRMMDGGLGTVADALRTWLCQSESHRAVLMSHDVRQGDEGDSDAVRALRDLMPEKLRPRVLLVDDSAMAWDMKALSGTLDLVLTGRMHLAIASLGMATPVLCLAYMGKFRGLMAHFGIDGMVVEPKSIGAPQDLVAAIMRLQADSGVLKARIDAKLPDIKALSRENFHWLD